MLTVRFYVERSELLNKLAFPITQLLSTRPSIDVRRKDCHSEIKLLEATFYNIEQCIKEHPEAVADLVQSYSRERYEELSNAVASVESKADWTMGLLAGIAGFALLHPVPFQSSSVFAWVWSFGLLCTVPGLFLCLRCRIPGDFPCTFSIVECIKNAELLDQYSGEVTRWFPQFPDITADQRLKLRIAKSRGLAEHGMKLLNKWKAQCVKAASFWLITSFVLIGASTAVDVAVPKHKPNAESSHPRSADPDTKGEAAAGVAHRRTPTETTFQ